MKYLENFDNWLLGKIEKFSHWWQKYFGTDCFGIARQASFFGLLSFCVVVWIMFNANELIAVNMFSIVLLSLCFLFIYKTLKKIENEVRASQIAKTANPYAMIAQFGRIYLLLFIPIHCITIYPVLCAKYGFLISLCYVCGILSWGLLIPYLLCCNPLPPAPARVQQWLQKLAALLTPTPVPVPVPVKEK